MTMKLLLTLFTLALAFPLPARALTQEQIKALIAEEERLKAARETPEAKAKAAAEAKARAETDDLFRKLKASLEAQGFSVADEEKDESEDFGGLVYKHYGRGFNFENRAMKNFKEWGVSKQGSFRRYFDPARAEEAYQGSLKSYRGDAGKKIDVLEGPTMRTKNYSTFKEETAAGGKYAVAATLNYSESFGKYSQSAGLTYVYLLAGYSGPHFYTGRMVVKREWSTDPKDRERPGYEELWVNDKGQVPEFDAGSFPFLDKLLAAYAPLTGAVPQAKVTLRLEASASPAMLAPDGVSTAAVRACLTSRPEDGSAPASPLAGARVTLELKPQDGALPGRLAQQEAVTGADGCVSALFTAPAKDKLGDGKITRAELAANSDGAQEELFYVDFKKAYTRLSALPELPGKGAPTAVIPADKRWPARLAVYLEDENLKAKAGETVTFRLESAEPKGELKAGGKAGVEVTAVTGADGVARALYYYTAAHPKDAPYLENIAIESAGLKAPLEAAVSCGVDLQLAGARSMYEGKGELNAGETVPLVLTVKDAWHPELKDLEVFLRHWTGGGEGAPPLGLRLELQAEGNAPLYLSEQLLVKRLPNEGFSDFVTPRFIAKRGETSLWVNANQPYVGVPRLTPRYTGDNRYTAQVVLADLAGRKALPDPDPANNRSVLTLKTGLAADAARIFLLEDPFGPHTAQARLFRTVLDTAGFGTVLTLTEVVTLINKGDVNALAEMAVNEALGWLAGEIGGKLNDKLTDWITDLPGGESALAAVTLTEEITEGLGSAAELIRSAQLDYTPYNEAFWGAPGEEEKAPEPGLTQEAFVQAILKKAGLKDSRLVVSTAASATVNGKQVAADKDGYGRGPDGAVRWLRKNARTVWLVQPGVEFSL